MYHDPLKRQQVRTGETGSLLDPPGPGCRGIRLREYEHSRNFSLFREFLCFLM
jgi:hypothetical protein